MDNPLTLLPCGLPKYAVEATHAACAAATERYGDRYDTSTVEEMAKRAAEVLDPVFDRLRELLLPHLCNVTSRSDRTELAALLGIDPDEFDYDDTDEKI